ncbi:MAG: SPOR domain-containing protein [Deltaproteobacteria bacterium]|nr:SPOR domain-containing protein [Deltaproteobacteria bacterium]
MARFHTVLALSAATVILSGCDASRGPVERGAPPPPVETAKPAGATCARPTKVADPSNVAALPPRAGNFCLDPSGSDRGYGDGAKEPLKPGICDVFDGECEIYVQHGAKRVNEARYVDDGGSKATVDVKHSRFGSPEQALAMFTKRALGAGDPAHPDTPRPIEGGGLATLGLGNAYVWRGSDLAEITVNDAELSVDELKKRGDELLPALVKDVGDRFTGPTELPGAAKLLPTKARLPNGIRYELADLLVTGGGAGAFGFYRDGDRRWRVLAAATTSEADAKAALAKLAAGGAPEKGPGDGATRVVVGPTKAEWLILRSGSNVLGVGDELLVLRAGMSDDERAKRSLTLDEKRSRLAALVTDHAHATPSGGTPAARPSK